MKMRTMGYLILSMVLPFLAACQSIPNDRSEAVDPVSLRVSAQRAYQSGDFISAESMLRRNLSIHQRDADSWFLLANIHLRSGQYAAAQHAYQQAALYKPEQAAIWHNLALVHIRLATQTLLQGMRHQDDDFEPLIGWLLEVQGVAMQ